MTIWRKLDLWIDGWLTPAGRGILGIMVAALLVALVLAWIA